MQGTEILIILQWWASLFILGFSCLPLTFKIFPNFADRGYIFSKILGIGILSYIAFVLGTFHILAFSRTSVILVLVFIFAINWFFAKGIKESFRKVSRIIIFEEIIFLVAIFVWSYVRGTNPEIRGLEKYMDFGFINSILRSSYFPPKDMWFAQESINYYYFGHLAVAALTHLSFIKSSITFNLSIATIFAFTLVGSFSIGANLFAQTKKRIPIIAGITTAIFVSFGGNLQTIYAFFSSHSGDVSPPIWKLIFSPSSFPNSYWYPNATRFIDRTIHEFPIYSFVVSDLHAHVLSLPFVILAIALLLSIFKAGALNRYLIIFFSFILSILYMTNTWDTVTYFFLASSVIFYIQWKNNSLGSAVLYLLLILSSTFIFILPFSINFQPFTSGIGIICAPQFLQNLGSLGPFLFEADHCQRSPLWQLLTLYGFFLFWILAFVLFIKKETFKTLKNADIFIIFLIVLSIALIILPEFVYIKDIYSGHYRANTMFKFVYQAFIMLQISSAYILIRLVSKIKETKIIDITTLVVLIFGSLLSVLVFLYPFFAVNSYYNGLKTYSGIDGEQYLETLYPADYAAINWLNKNVKDQPVILEAQGDSYSDYARISSNTGLPTVIGWPVHEWLWRGSYDPVAPRVLDVKLIYETMSRESAKNLIEKYDISYIYIGYMEGEKYSVAEDKFKELGKVVFESGGTKIYKIN